MYVSDILPSSKQRAWLQFLPYGFSLLAPKLSRESDLGHKVNMFYILYGHFDENKIGGTTLPGGRASRQSQRVRGPSKSEGDGWMQHFSFLSHHLKYI